MWIFGGSPEKEWTALMKQVEDAFYQRRYGELEASLSKAALIPAKFGDADERHAATLFKLAEHVQLMGDFDRADQYYQSALGVYENANGSSSESVARTL